MAERDSFGSFFVGFLAGVVAGGIATILYAPNSGVETRNSIREKKDDLLEKANLSIDDAYKQAEIAAKDARDQFEALANMTRNKAEEVARRGQVILEERIASITKSADSSSEYESVEIPASED